MAFLRRLGLFAAVLLGASAAGAAPPTPGYPEPVVQWGVQKGETCEDIARSLYGSPKYASLVQRYNHVACKANAPLAEGTTLVLPEKPTTLPDAKLRSMNPDVRARPGGGAWSAASPGMALYSNYNVNTLEQGRADVEFIDRTRIFLAANTLVVIYGTASQTRVSKTPPAAVEVESGEVKAGLAALRGAAVEVEIKGGGRISAASRDTVVQRKGDRTTVAVFDGKAGVTSAGKSVDVPKNFGTRFVTRKPPAPPRPLPPAPAWTADSERVMLAPGGLGTIAAAWDAVPGAVSYRFEVARDPEFHNLVVREEVPAKITAFRGEKMPVGTYYMAVRAIDKEEYLGVAAPTRQLYLVEARLESGDGRLTAKEVDANPYAVLKLGPSSELEMAVDEGPFGPMPSTIDLLQRAPRALRVRALGKAGVDTISVAYRKVGAALQATASADMRQLAVSARLEGMEGVDVAKRVAPTGRARLPDGVRTFALAAGPGGAYAGTLALPAATPERVRVDVVDARGAVLGTTEWKSPAAPPVEARRATQIGAYAPLWQLSPSTDVLWSAPTPPSGAAVSVGVGRANGGYPFQGHLRAGGAVGPVGLDAAIRTSTTDGKSSEGAAWLGAHVLVWRHADQAFELAPALRVGFPIAAQGAPARLEPSVALGGVHGRFTWLADLGARVRLTEDTALTGTPKAQGFLLGGGTFDPLPWMRLHALLDMHVVARDGASSFFGGLGAGIEAGTVVYGSLGVRLSPWSDPGFGAFTGQLALGFRSFP